LLFIVQATKPEGGFRALYIPAVEGRVNKFSQGHPIDLDGVYGHEVGMRIWE
jgi:hypothetical protein